MVVGGQHLAAVSFTPEKELLPIVHEAGWVAGPVWTGAENIALTLIRSPDRPACNESLYVEDLYFSHTLLAALLRRRPALAETYRDSSGEEDRKIRKHAVLYFYENAPRLRYFVQIDSCQIK